MGAGRLYFLGWDKVAVCRGLLFAGELAHRRPARAPGQVPAWTGESGPSRIVRFSLVSTVIHERHETGLFSSRFADSAGRFEG